MRLHLCFCQTKTFFSTETSCQLLDSRILLRCCWQVLRRELEVGVRRESAAELSVAAASQQPFSIAIAVVTAAASGSS